LPGCNRDRLSIYTEYINPADLASSFVQTPNPCQNDPTLGQRLILSWLFPKEYIRMNDLHIDLTIRLRNREEIKKKIPIKHSSGTYTYSLIDEDFFEKKGILTYKADVVGNCQILDTWRHQLWTELIILHVD
jgi:hypothetical protein